MTTVAAVRKDKEIAIAADSLSKWGSMKESAKYVADSDKILRYEDNLIAVTGSASLKLILDDWLTNARRKPDFSTVGEIFRAFLGFHKTLKEEYFIRAEDDDEDEFESSRVNILIANPHGIFAVGAYRTVQEFTRFTAMGSGVDFAYGAMFSVYENADKNAAEIAEIGIRAAAEFDDSTELPVTLHKIKLDK